MSNLFELSADYKKLLDMAEQGVDEETIQDTIESLGLDEDIESKADNYAYILRRLDGNIEMVDKEIKRLQAIKKTHVNTQKRLKDNLFESMKMTKKEKFKTATNNFYIKKNAVSVIVEDDKFIPKRFYETQKVLNKKEFNEYVKDLDKKREKDKRYRIPKGVRLEQSESVIIR